jgi:hypothetical protein
MKIHVGGIICLSSSMNTPENRKASIQAGKESCSTLSFLFMLSFLTEAETV